MGILLGLIFAIFTIIVPSLAIAAETKSATKPGQIPLSSVAYGNKNIKAAWFSDATSRYRHGVLGDAIEAASLSVEIKGKILKFTLPDNRVFEDIEPRLADINHDEKDEIIVIESDVRLGASLVVFAEKDGRLVRFASTPFIGRSNRWLNPLGVGDFDGDGKNDIALVSTPHIGGVLRLYHLDGNKLVEFASIKDVSTHSIGSTELGLGVVVLASPRSWMLVPNQAKNAMRLLEWGPKGWIEHKRVQLPARVISSLKNTGDNKWQAELDNGQSYSVE